MPKVLIVDDEPATVDLLRVYLQMKGFQVVCAYNGTEAIEFARVERPDVIILDIMLPNMSGDNVCREIRKDKNIAHIPVIVLSALTSRADADKALEAGANYFMSKPIRFPQLFDHLKTVLALA